MADDNQESTTCMHREKHGRIGTTNMMAIRELKGRKNQAHESEQKHKGLNINGKSWGLMAHGQGRSTTPCTYEFCIHDVYHMVIGCPRHKVARREVAGVSRGCTCTGRSKIQWVQWSSMLTEIQCVQWSDTH